MNDDNSSNHDGDHDLPRPAVANPFFDVDAQPAAPSRPDMAERDEITRPGALERDHDDFLFGNAPSIAPDEQACPDAASDANGGGADMAGRGEVDLRDDPGAARRDAPEHTPEPETDVKPAPPDSADLVSVEEAVHIFRERGLPRHMRTIQKYCAKKTGRALTCYQVPTENGIRYMIERASIDRFIGDAAQQAPTARINEQPEMATPNPTEAAPTNTLDIFDHPFVKRLEDQVSRLESRNEQLQSRIENVLINANERLVELQKANAVAQSESLGTFLLEAERIRNGQHSEPDVTHSDINREGERSGLFPV